MWNLISRQFKQTFEHSHKFFDVRKFWNCRLHTNRQQIPSCNVSSPEPNTALYISQYVSHQDALQYSAVHRQRDHSRNFCPRLWSAPVAIIGVACFHWFHKRRHLRQLDKEFNLHLFDKRQSQYKNYCLYHCYISACEKFSVPSASRKQTTKKSKNASLSPSVKDRNISALNAVNLPSFYRPVNVNNDHVQQTSSDGGTNVVDEIENLMRTIGHIEFKLGLQNIDANQLEVAVSHFKLASTHRHPGATFNLGLCYETGAGVDRDEEMAMECYREAAALGHKSAMYNIGVFHARGRGGLEKNRDAALKCVVAAGLNSDHLVYRLKDKQKADEEIVNDWKSPNYSAQQERNRLIELPKNEFLA